MRKAAKSQRGDVFLRGKLEGALGMRTFKVLVWAGRLAESMGSTAYLVGGIVRDAILGYPNTDLDVTVEGDAEVVARALARRIRGDFREPTEFGTCKVEARGFGTIDFATSRSETYARPGALPKVLLSDIADDLWRRDFTVNAMAVCLNPGELGKLFDPCRGLADLTRGVLRVMHEVSFTDDPTRILRGIRFAARYGYRFDAGTLRLLRASVRARSFKTISGKRIYRELSLICAEPQAAKAIRLLERYGVLGALGAGGVGVDTRHKIWRALGDASAWDQGMMSGLRGDLGLAWFASLFAGLGESAARQMVVTLNLPREAREPSVWTAAHLGKAVRCLASRDAADAYEIRQMLDQVPRPCLMHIWALSSRRAKEMVELYIGLWRHVKPSLTGGEIARMGLGEGPQVGRMLDGLLRLRLDGKIKTRDDEVAAVRRLTARGDGLPPAGLH